MGNFQYQIKAANKVLEMALDSFYKAAVLAACPGSGKSTILIHILNLYSEKFPNFKALVLTHNQNILKEQMLENFNQPNVPVNFTFGSLGFSGNVQVGIPASKSQITEFDLLIVDEAHEYYGEDLVDGIIDTFKPKHQILMTGSPSKFTKHNKTSIKTYGIHYISVEDLQASGVFSKVNLDIVKTSGSISTQIRDILRQMSQHRMGRGKMMWACKSIAQANEVRVELEKCGYNTFLSTSENDPNSKEIKDFKESSKGILIVVNKGILGFSDEEIETLIDMKKSKDPEVRNQLFARILRKSKKSSSVKNYLTVAGKDFNSQLHIIHSMVKLAERLHFRSYTGL